jgi:hypothetical protein
MKKLYIGLYLLGYCVSLMLSVGIDLADLQSIRSSGRD